jgi:hypothetical protein
MALKANVGVSRKVADNNYGSRGASVNLEVELESALVNEPERFHDRIRQVFRLAQQAIDEELTRQQGNGTASHATNGTGNGRVTQPSKNTGNGQPSNGSTANGNGQSSNGSAKTVSEKQLNFAKQLSKGIPNLGVRRLENLAQRMYGKPLVAMTSMEASGLIDTLKSIKDGAISLDSVLEGNAA